MAFAETAPAPRALKVEWNEPGGRVRIPVLRDTRSADGLDFRMAGAPGAPPVEFDVRVRDASGQWAKLTERPLKLRSYFGPSPLGKVVARQLRVRLDGAKIDARHITDVELIPRSERGRFWLLDISTWRRSLANSDQIHLPRVSVEDVVVPEGDSGEITLEVPVTIDGTITKPGRVWVQLTDSANFEQPTSGFPLELEPGMTSASIPFVYEADDIYDPFPRFVQVTLLAQRNVVTGNYDGSILVEEDDPPPVLTVDSRHVTAAEGSSLTWTFRLSKPLANGAFWSVQFLPTGGRFAELDSDDVPPSFLEAFGITPPDPAIRLSELGLFLSVEFAPDTRAVTLSIPIARDDVSEASEGVVLLLDGFGDPVVPQPIELTGMVTGAAP
jgi:hypothetical protein